MGDLVSMCDKQQQPPISPGQIQRIAIIGGGPAGIAAAKYLLAENAFSQIVVYEERPGPGGVWLASPDLPPKEAKSQGSEEPARSRPSPAWPKRSYEISQPTPKNEAEPVYLHENGNGKGWDIESPIYNQLTTNLPKELMRFSDLPFPEECHLMPSHEVVKAYLEEYSQEIIEKGIVKFGRRVTEVVPRKDEKGRREWRVTSTHVLDTEKEETEVYDAVVVASGHYTAPFIPDIPGLKDCVKDDTAPRIIHSKSWRHPPKIKQKVLIIGAGISGMDIADHIAKSGSQVLLASRTFRPGGEKPPIVTHADITYIHPVAEFLPPSPTSTSTTTTNPTAPPNRRKIAVKLRDGTEEGGIEQVIFATGYFYTFPFLPPSVLTSLGLSLRPLSRTGPVNAILGLYQHLIPQLEPTLSFLGLPSRIVPFPVVEVQSAYIARLLSSRLSLPPTPSMVAWESSLIFEKMKDGGSGLAGDIRELIGEVAMGDVQEINIRARRYVNADFHTMTPGADASYINTLSSLCSSADKHSLEKNGKVQGKKPPYWDEQTRWLRRLVPLIQRVVREGDREMVRGLRGVGDVLGTFEEWREVEGRGEEGVEEEKRRILRRFGVGREEEEGEGQEDGVGLGIRRRHIWTWKSRRSGREDRN